MSMTTRPHPPGPVRTLRDAARQERDFWALCRTCGKSSAVRTGDLIFKTPNVPIKELAQRMVCKRCHRHDCELIPQTQTWPGRG